MTMKSMLTRIFCSTISRKYSTGSGDVRVRFAPSPTGNLHLGGLRTALYNYLFARSHRGKFILRIEDTDQARLVAGAQEQLEADLEWAGLVPDEGPSAGGSHGPYVQSHRLHMYTEEADHLIARGAAYHCFCTEKRLDLLRKDAVRNRQVPKYDNRCRSLTSVEVRQKLADGLKSCIRFKLVPSEGFRDLVYGLTDHEVGEIEGDPVILKSDGWPTYHLANVVDDHRMAISHVIRGAEWLLSTPKHIMIYRAFGYSPPQFAHLPLLLNSDGGKLSKRQEDIGVISLRQRGVMPRALVNFVIRAGGGFPIPPPLNSSLEHLVTQFDLSAVSTSSGKLPMDRLSQFNQMELERMINDHQQRDSLINQVKSLVRDKFAVSGDSAELDTSSEHIETVLLWSLPRITSLKDLIDTNLQFLWVVPNSTDLVGCDVGILEELENELENEEFCKRNLVEYLKKFSKQRNVQFKDLMVILRTTLSGLKQGPGVAEMMEILGKSTTISRIKRAKQLINSSSTQ